MKKMLMVASVPSMIGQFNMPNIDILQRLGYEVHVACNFEDRTAWTDEKVNMFQENLRKNGIKAHQICFSRSASNMKSHLKSYKQLLDLVRKENFEFIHCHTPIGGAISRLVAHSTKTKVIYTAHGFHFYKGAPLKNWVLFYPIEKWLSKYTDVLITINSEDYKRAKSFYAKKVINIPGVGVDVNRFNETSVSKKEKREELGVPVEATVLLSVGELNKNKNHMIVLKALSEIKNRNVFYIICGQGNLKGELENLASKFGVSEQVKFLGYRNDMKEIYQSADIFVFPSFREGLSVALMEAMANGLPCIVSDIRGNRDLISDGENGVLVSPYRSEEFAKAITYTLSNVNLLKSMAEECKNRITKFSCDEVVKLMKQIYILVD